MINFSNYIKHAIYAILVVNYILIYIFKKKHPDNNKTLNFRNIRLP